MITEPWELPAFMEWVEEENPTEIKKEQIAKETMK